MKKRVLDNNNHHRDDQVQRVKTNLCALYGLKQVGQGVSEGASEEPTQLLKQGTNAGESRPETHGHGLMIEYEGKAPSLASSVQPRIATSLM